MIKFGKITETGIEYPFDILINYPNTSFPENVQEHNLTESMVADGIVVVEQEPPPVKEGYYASQDGLEVVGGAWKTKWRLTPYPPAIDPSVPSVVTMRQARLALHAIGKLSGIDEVIDSLPEDQKAVAQIEWGYAKDVERDSDFVALLGLAIGLDDAGIDNLFKEAIKL